MRSISRSVFTPGAAGDWKRLSAGAGTKGPRLYDWAYCELADLDGPASGDGPVSRWTRGLLTRRNIADGALAYFSTWCPYGTGIETLVHVEGHRWSVEDDFKTGKNEFGLDHNETRSWHGWHRHVSLSMLALGMMCAVRHRANLAEHPKKTSATASADLICWSMQEIRRLTIRLRARRVTPAHVIAWSGWRRAHQARARKAHLKKCNCSARYPTRLCSKSTPTISFRDHTGRPRSRDILGRRC